MRFGLCCSADVAPKAIEAGFDYAEVAASNLTETVESLLSIPVDATNLFFPSAFRLFEPTVGDYVGHALDAVDAASRLGVQVMVIGSGNQRTAPSDMAPEDALARFVEIVAEVAEIAFAHDIQVAPESLNRDETNVGNDLATLATALSSRGIGFTADSYHIFREGYYNGVEVDWNAQIPTAPTHVHLADVPRNLPSFGDRQIQRFLIRLKELGYDSRISFEGSLQEATLSQAASRLRQLWEAV